jgi:hypothetical protein
VKQLHHNILNGKTGSSSPKLNVDLPIFGLQTWLLKSALSGSKDGIHSPGNVVFNRLRISLRTMRPQIISELHILIN